jgi:hypothetical protein
MDPVKVKGQREAMAEGLRQEDCEFKATLGYIARPSLSN